MKYTLITAITAAIASAQDIQSIASKLRADPKVSGIIKEFNTKTADRADSYRALLQAADNVVPGSGPLIAKDAPAKQIAGGEDLTLDGSYKPSKGGAAPKSGVVTASGGSKGGPKGSEAATATGKGGRAGSSSAADKQVASETANPHISTSKKSDGKMTNKASKTSGGGGGAANGDASASVSGSGGSDASDSGANAGGSSSGSSSGGGSSSANSLVLPMGVFVIAGAALVF